MTLNICDNLIVTIEGEIWTRDIMDVDDNFAPPCLRPWPPHLIKFFPLHRGGGVGIAILWWKKVKKIVEKLGNVYFFSMH